MFSKTTNHAVLLPGTEENDRYPDNKTKSLLILRFFSLLFDEYLDLQFLLKKVMVNRRMVGAFHGEEVLCISIF